MELNQELYDLILKALEVKEPKDRAAAGPREARRALRLETDVRVQIAPYGTMKATPRDVQLRSISRSGLAIMDSMAMHAGDKFVVSLLKGGGEPVTILCTARNSRWAGTRFRTGAEFTSGMECQGHGIALGAEGIEKTGDQAECLTESNAASRRPNRLEVKFSASMWVYNGNSLAEAAEVKVCDFSKGGIGIIHDQDLPVESRFLLEVPLQGSTRRLLCSVANCRPVGDGSYRIGATFVDQPALGVLGRLRQWIFKKSA